MTSKSPILLVAVALIHLAVQPAQADNQIEGRSCVPAKDVRELVDRAEVVPAAQAIAVAKTARPGEAVKVRLCRLEDHWHYLVTLLAKDGKIRILAIEGRTGVLVEHH